MRKLQEYFNDYSSFHHTLGNQRTHLLGIPMIVISVFSWASTLIFWRTGLADLPSKLFQLDLGVVMLVLASFWYLLLDWALAISFMPVLFGLYWVGRALSPGLAAIFFVLGWIFQGIGHFFYEKKAPAFSKNIEHLLIGPIWLFVKLTRIEK